MGAAVCLEHTLTYAYRPPTQPAGSDHGTASSREELEAENAALKKKVAQLQAALTSLSVRTSTLVAERCKWFHAAWCATPHGEDS